MIRILLLVLLALPLRAGVGVDEKLGHTIPLELTLRDEANQPVVLGQLLDKPTLLTLNYFGCASLCTPQLNGLADTLNRMGAAPGTNFQVISVSFDPRDTPETAHRKRDTFLSQISHPLPDRAWNFLTGEPKATRALADAVGFRFEPRGEDFDHPAVVVVLSPGGRITKYIYGLTYLPAELQMATEEASRGELHPSVAKILNICFRYDPQQRKQVFSLTRAVGTFVVVSALLFLGYIAFRGPRSRP